jgi:hypothetical protein
MSVGEAFRFIKGDWFAKMEGMRCGIGETTAHSKHL